MAQWVLGIDSTQSVLHVAARCSSTSPREGSSQELTAVAPVERGGRARGAGEQLLALISHVLREIPGGMSAVDAVHVATGPGSYTGIRIGIACASGLCFGWNGRLCGVGTLAARVRGVDLTSAVVVPYLIAGLNRAYFAAYRTVEESGGERKELFAPHYVVANEGENLGEIVGKQAKSMLLEIPELRTAVAAEDLPMEMVNVTSPNTHMRADPGVLVAGYPLAPDCNAMRSLQPLYGKDYRPLTLAERGA